MTVAPEATPHSPLPPRPGISAGHLWSMPLAALAAFAVIMWCRFLPARIGYTENDAIPSAHQWASPSWLPQDWYLNLDIGYRAAANLLLGPLASHSPTTAISVGRMLSYAGIAVAMVLIWRALDLGLGVGLLVLYASLQIPSLGAGEQIAGGADAKGLAWPFVLLAVAAVLRQRWSWAAAALGLALSFHVLIGLQAGWCLGLAVLLNARRLGLGWRDLRAAWPVLLTGAWGWWEVAGQLAALGSDTSDAQARTGWLTYVGFRVPHHVDPSTWNSPRWIVLLLASAAVIALALLLLGPGARRRAGLATAPTTADSTPPSAQAAHQLALIAGCALGLFGFGLAVSWWAEVTWSRFYWFRFADSFVPLAVLLLLGWALARLLPVLAQRLVTVAAVTLTAVAAGNAGGALLTTWQQGVVDDTAMTQWIRQNTADDARLLVSPERDDLYLSAQRAVFVTYRHAPQAADDLVEWQRRLEASTGVRLEPGGRVGELVAGFGALSEQQLRQLAVDEDLDYYLVRERDDLELPVLAEFDGWQLYALPH